MLAQLSQLLEPNVCFKTVDDACECDLQQLVQSNVCPSFRQYSCVTKSQMCVVLCKRNHPFWCSVLLLYNLELKFTKRTLDWLIRLDDWIVLKPVVRLRTWSCWKVDQSQISGKLPSRISLYVIPSIFTLTLTSLLIPSVEKPPHTIMLSQRNTLSARYYRLSVDGVLSSMV